MKILERDNADEDGFKWQHSKARDFGAEQKKVLEIAHTRQTEGATAHHCQRDEEDDDDEKHTMEKV